MFKFRDFPANLTAQTSQYRHRNVLVLNSVAEFGEEIDYVSQESRTFEATKYCPWHLSTWLLVCKSVCLFLTKIKYTVALNERAFLTMN